MRRTSLGEYLESPLGKWVSGAGWLHFCLSEPLLSGVVLWGHVDVAVIDVILRCSTAANAAVPEKHPALVDGGRAASYDMAPDVMVWRLGRGYRAQEGFESPGGDFLHLYWFARKYGLLSATD